MVCNACSPSLTSATVAMLVSYSGYALDAVDLAPRRPARAAPPDLDLRSRVNEAGQMHETTMRIHDGTFCGSRARWTP